MKQTNFKIPLIYLKILIFSTGWNLLQKQKYTFNLNKSMNMRTRKKNAVCISLVTPCLLVLTSSPHCDCIILLILSFL